MSRTNGAGIPAPDEAPALHSLRNGFARVRLHEREAIPARLPVLVVMNFRRQRRPGSHALILGTVTTAAWLVVASCGGTPVAPSVPEIPATPVPPTTAGRVVSVTDTNTGVSGVNVSVDGAAPFQSDASGAFSTRLPAGTHALNFTHPQFVTRQTHAVLPASDLLASLMPSSFDLAAFNEFSPRTRGLRRWASNPSLVVLTNAVDYVNGATRFRVTDHVVPADGFSCMLNGIAGSIGEMSGGALSFVNVTPTTPSVDSYFDITTTAEGTIVAMAARDLGANGRGNAYEGSTPDVFVRGVVWINADALPLCSTTSDGVYPHELGHALGYQHVTLEPSIMSGIGPTRTPTAFDRAAIAYIYQRPPGNRAPDIDPSNYTINTQSAR